MPKILVIDFDGTIVEDRYPKIGKPIKGALETIMALKEAGYKLILWTCREGDNLNDAVEFLKQNGIVFDSVNEPHPDNPFSHLGKNRKPYAHYHIDDKNFGGLPKWSNINKHFFRIKKYHEIKQTPMEKAFNPEPFYSRLLSLIFTFMWSFPFIFILYIMTVCVWINLKITAVRFKEESNFLIFTIQHAIDWYQRVTKKLIVLISLILWGNVILYLIIKW